MGRQQWGGAGWIHGLAQELVQSSAQHGRGGPWSSWTDTPGRPGHGGHGGHGRQGGHGGPPPWLQGLFGMAPPGAPAQGPKVRRGDVRMAILDVLRQAAADGTAVNGYQVIQSIAERSDGAWRPSPGSVYPTIQRLQDEGLVEADDERGRRTLRLTGAGTTYVEERADELRGVWAPFERSGRPGPPPSEDGGPDLRGEIGQVLGAVWQIITQGSEEQRRAAVETLVATRRALYGILADGAGARSAPAEGTGAADDGDDGDDSDHSDDRDER